MRGWAVTLLLGITACDRVWNLDSIDDPTRRDADIDIDADVTDAPPDARACYGSNGGLFQTCLTAPLDPEITFTGVLDTENDTHCRVVVQPSGQAVCVIATERVTILGEMVVRGGLPLVLISGDTITLDAIVNASGTSARAGAGAVSLNMCGNAGNGGDATNGGAGGSGGTFAYRGGKGMGGGGMASTAHDPEPVVPVSGLRGGCQGANGGLSTSQGGVRGRGGYGGGAVELIAATSITVTSNGGINASGGGGLGGPKAGGGGGGGSGGMIALDAPVVTIAGPLWARGGGGGSGGSDLDGGNKGSEASGPTGSVPGGVATSTGNGSGGGWPGCGAPDGTIGGDYVPNGAAMTAGGGGGGGACGFIYVFADDKAVNATANPLIRP